MDRRAWRATVHRVAKSWAQLKRLSMHVASNIKGIKTVIFNWYQMFYNLLLISRHFGAQFNKKEHLTQFDCQAVMSLSSGGDR